MARTTRKGVRQAAAESAPAPAEDITAAAPATTAAEGAPPADPPPAPAEGEEEKPEGYQRAGLQEIFRKRRIMAEAEARGEDPAEALTKAMEAEAAGDPEPTPPGPAAEGEPPVTPAEEPAAPAAEPLTPPAAEPAAPAAAEPAAPGTPEPARLHKIKVNGVERLVTDEDLLKLAQQGLSATEKWQEASRLRAEAEELARRNSGADRAPASGTTEPPAGDPPNPASTDSKVDLKGIAEKLQFGKTEEAEAALQQVIETAVQRATQGRPAATPDDIVRQAVDTVRSETMTREALTEFGNKYADIANDPYLRSIAAQNVTLIRAQTLIDLGYDAQQVQRATPAQILATIRREQAAGRAKADTDVFLSAGAKVKEWLASKVPQPAGDAPPVPPKPAAAAPAVSSTRTATKAAAPQPPRYASAPRAATPPPPPAKRGSDVVAEMRKARGQA